MSISIEQEARRIKRFSLALPVRVGGRFDRTHSWDEITRLTDISAFGAGFTLKRHINPGQLLQMTMSLPRQMRCYDYAEPQYRIWGLVRNCITKENAAKGEFQYSIGVAFIGKHPPSSYFDDPKRVYDILHQGDGKLWTVIEVPTDPTAIDATDAVISAVDLRRHSRLAIPTEVTLEKLDSEGNVIASEMTVTENLSLSGAAIFSTLSVETGEFVRVKSGQYDVSIISVVRGKRLGSDNIPRVHIEFIDRCFPLEGIV